MRLSLRFFLPLVLILGLVAYGVGPLVSKLTFRWFSRDLELRSRLITTSMQDSVVLNLQSGNRERIQHLFDRAIQDERLYAIGFCDQNQQLTFRSNTMPASITCLSFSRPPVESTEIKHLPEGPLLVGYYPLLENNSYFGQLILVHDLSFIERRSDDTKRYIFYFFAILSAVISVLTVLIAQLSLKGWTNSLRKIVRKESILRPISRFTSPELRPIVKDLKLLIRDIESDRRARDEHNIRWDSGSLKKILQEELAGDEVLIVSNREPYIHTRTGDQIEAKFPASGLVTALEPVMRACSGTWIAHGSGNADKETVDRHDRVRVPPEKPSYQIRRVWLTEEEEKGYYYGFSNEGLWALCHIAHVRPNFRSDDWKTYKAVNEKFAEAVVQEAKTDDPVVLVQDYHLALVPQMIKDKLPKATIITFWHIPFPNSEVFGICPWREEILKGLLGSSILGFHTRFHCNNFLGAIDKFLESRIDRENSTVSRKGQMTAINQYPISIEYPAKWMEHQKPVAVCRQDVRARNQLSSSMKIGIGVDRLDYTKGILERFRAVERLFELHPEHVGTFSFIQIAAPSRSSIEEYKRFHEDVMALATRINTRFGSENYLPIILKVEHHEPEQVFEYFRASELCFVSSLHDGMNLVAKEFVAARDDERGVLILSRFTGAAREMPESLIVNPYDSDQCATALHMALLMKSEEQRDRMRSMRRYVQEYNVYRWAGRMLLDASRLRQHQRILGRER